MNLQIFGRRVLVQQQTSGSMETLLGELALYPEAEGAGAPDYTLRLVDRVPLEGSANPSLHIEAEDGFVMRAPTGDIRFVLDGAALAAVEVAIRRDRSRVSAMIARGRNIQYATPRESAGQTVHELALVPAVMFDSSRFALHSSAFQGEDGGVILIGGTGGVGKTSLALELCRKRGYRFLADDISIVANDGHVSPNLAFPKIYRYNVTGDRRLRNEIFSRSSVANRAQWLARGVLGADKARRRVSPVQLYGGYSRTGGWLRTYVILMRDDGTSIRFDALSARAAARMSSAVISAEFWHFANHLHWHRYNRLGQGKEAVLDPLSIFRRWETQAERVLEGRRLILCRIPRTMPITAVKRDFSTWLESEA